MAKEKAPKDRESTDEAKDKAAAPLREFNTTNEEKNEAVEKIADLERAQIEREEEELDEMRESGDSQASLAKPADEVSEPDASKK